MNVNIRIRPLVQGRGVPVSHPELFRSPFGWDLEVERVPVPGSGVPARAVVELGDDDESSFIDNCVFDEYQGSQDCGRFVSMGVGHDESFPAFFFSFQEKNIGICHSPFQSL